MQVAALTNKHQELGVALASLSLNEMILRALVRNGLLCKQEALSRLRGTIIRNMQTALPANLAAAKILERMLDDMEGLEVSAAA